MTISWPDNLVNDIARRRCVLFLGSGISQNSTNMAGIHPKTWKELLLAGITRIPKQFHSCIKKHILRKRPWMPAKIRYKNVYPAWCLYWQKTRSKCPQWGMVHIKGNREGE